MTNPPTPTVTVDGWKFRRVSEAYIDVYAPGTSTPVDCINVYDYAVGGSDIPRTAAATRKEAREWLAEHAGHDLNAYIDHARYSGY